MKIRYFRLPGCIAALAIVLQLAGCLTPGPSPRFYLLDAEAYPVAGTEAGNGQRPSGQNNKTFTVVLKDIRLPQYLDRPQIVTRDDGNRLEVNEFEQWASPLRDDMMRVLVANLGSLLQGIHVVAAPYHGVSAPDLRVEVDILIFERAPGGRVKLSAQWRITRGVDGALLMGVAETLSGEPIPVGAPYEKLVASMSRVYGELAQLIAKSVRQQGMSAS